MNVRPLGGTTLLLNRQRSVLAAPAEVFAQSVVVVLLSKSDVVLRIPTWTASLLLVLDVLQGPYTTWIVWFARLPAASFNLIW